MVELIGCCSDCNKKIYCRDGFLDGVTDGKTLLCFDCVNKNKPVSKG